MSALARLQHDFQAHVLGRRGNDQIVGSVVASAAAAGDERLNVYVYAYGARLAEVLGNDFPGLHALAGDDDFASQCRAYINATPSTHYNVRWYGQGLAEFLRDTSPWSENPALAEMAEFEWSLGLCFDAPDQDHVVAGDVQALTPEQWPELRLRLHGAMRRLTLKYNVAAIRLAVDREEDVPDLSEFDTAQLWLISRQDTFVRHRGLAADEAAALTAAQDGACFAELCEVLFEWHDEESVAMRAATLLGQWIQDQCVVQLLPAE